MVIAKVNPSFLATQMVQGVSGDKYIKAKKPTKILNSRDVTALQNYSEEAVVKYIQILTGFDVCLFIYKINQDTNRNSLKPSGHLNLIT